MKTVNDIILDSALTNIANVIRLKGSFSEVMTFPSGFIDKLSTITNYSGFLLSINPNGLRSVLLPPSGYNAISAIYVDGEPNLLEDNIRYGVRIFDVIGICDGGMASIVEQTIKYINSPATKIGNRSFEGCSSLSTAIFSQCSIVGFEAFRSCTTLSNVSIPNCENIYAYGFEDCSMLSEVSFPACSYIGIGALAGCSLKSVSFSLVTSIYENTFRNNYHLSVANIPNATKIGLDAFRSCSSLMSVSFPLCGQISHRAFMDCENLMYVSIPACTYIGMSAFERCGKLSYIELADYSHSWYSVTLSQYAFNYCSHLETVKLYNGYIDSHTFRSCHRLMSVYILGSQVAGMHDQDVFTSTPIEGYTLYTSGYGSIYVPSSLYSNYLSAGNWRRLSSRITSYIESST